MLPWTSAAAESQTMHKQSCSLCDTWLLEQPHAVELRFTDVVNFVYILTVHEQGC